MNKILASGIIVVAQVNALENAITLDYQTYLSTHTGKDSSRVDDEVRNIFVYVIYVPIIFRPSLFCRYPRLNKKSLIVN